MSTSNDSWTTVSKNPLTVLHSTEKNFLNMSPTERAGLLSGPRIPIVVNDPAGKYEVKIHIKMLEAFITSDLQLTNGKVVLPPSITSETMDILIHYMKANCKTVKPFKVPLQNRWTYNVELYKAAIVLCLGDAEKTLWHHLRWYTRRLIFEPEDLDIIYSLFLPSDPIAQHVVANVEWTRAKEGLSDSAEAFIESHPLFERVLNKFRAERLAKRNAQRAQDAQARLQGDNLRAPDVQAKAPKALSPKPQSSGFKRR